MLRQTGKVGEEKMARLGRKGQKETYVKEKMARRATSLLLFLLF